MHHVMAPEDTLGFVLLGWLIAVHVHLQLLLGVCVCQVELPLGATEDRICGTIDIEKALTEGVKAYEPGLLVCNLRNCHKEAIEQSVCATVSCDLCARMGATADSNSKQLWGPTAMTVDNPGIMGTVIVWQSQLHSIRMFCWQPEY